MNNDFRPIVEQAKRSEDIDDKVNCVITLMEVLCNHIPSMDKRIKKLERALYFVAVIILIALLGTNQLALDFILGFFSLF